MDDEVQLIGDSTWDFCLTGADQLVRWHEEHQQGAAVWWAQQRSLVVVFMASAIHSRASLSALKGSQVASVALGDAYGAGVLGTVRSFALAAIEGAPARQGLGAQERRALLDCFGTHAFDSLQQAVQEVLLHHLGASRTADPSLGDRSAAVTA
ncbi:hypothetical protein ACEZCY_04400 [Streptacidiphilus sp. N1-12]|uniref:Uncharacterized protein n=2 Tax=Streptacidiphilus alkalitolerans TaxID=3342712 RepID=A0ABV6XBW7_9ACTN